VKARNWFDIPALNQVDSENGPSMPFLSAPLIESVEGEAQVLAALSDGRG
jgi:hypothetical protein